MALGGGGVAYCFTPAGTMKGTSHLSGLPFRSQTEFRKADLDARQTLYQQLAQQIWSPERLEREAES